MTSEDSYKEKKKTDAYENSQKSLSDTSCYGLNFSLMLVIILGFKVSYYASNFLRQD